MFFLITWSGLTICNLCNQQFSQAIKMAKYRCFYRLVFGKEVKKPVPIKWLRRGARHRR